jgi:hypothetical protein
LSAGAEHVRDVGPGVTLVDGTTYRVQDVGLDVGKTLKHRGAASNMVGE